MVKKVQGKVEWAKNNVNWVPRNPPPFALMVLDHGHA